VAADGEEGQHGFWCLFSVCSYAPQTVTQHQVIH
jgi:hypothetical protein